MSKYEIITGVFQVWHVGYTFTTNLFVVYMKIPRPELPKVKEFECEDYIGLHVYGETDAEKVEAFGKAIDRLVQRKERLMEKYKKYLEEGGSMRQRMIPNGERDYNHV